MATIFGVLVILAVAGIMVYMQLTGKTTEISRQAVEEQKLYHKSLETLKALDELVVDLSTGGYLDNPEEKQKYFAAIRLLGNTAEYFDPKNADRRE